MPKSIILHTPNSQGPQCPYTSRGFTDRTEYLEHQAEYYKISIETVSCLSLCLGPQEDFDGLISILSHLYNKGTSND